MEEKPLVLLEEAGKCKKGKIGLYRCGYCGKTKKILHYSVKSGNTKSCGCLQKIKVAESGRKNKKHGLSNTREFKIWSAMKERCYNKKNKSYKNYGARGITVCDRWLESFENFYEDMGPRPSCKHTLERLDNEVGYCKENCVWETRKIQARNTRRTRSITYKGETKSLPEWSEITGLAGATILARIDRYGFTIEEALETAKMKNQFG